MALQYLTLLYFTLLVVTSMHSCRERQRGVCDRAEVRCYVLCGRSRVSSDEMICVISTFWMCLIDVSIRYYRVCSKEKRRLPRPPRNKILHAAVHARAPVRFAVRNQQLLAFNHAALCAHEDALTQLALPIAPQLELDIRALAGVAHFPLPGLPL